MENWVTNGFLFISIFFFGIIALYFILSRNQNKKRNYEISPRNNQTQDFSAFESSPDKFTVSIENESGEENSASSDEYTLKGDMDKFEEFLEKLRQLPRDVFDDIMISKGEEDDLLIYIQLDDEEGLILELYFTEEEDAKLSVWLEQANSIMQNFNLEADEYDPEDGLILINLESKSNSECKEIVTRFLNELCFNSGKPYLVEFTHY